MIPILARALVVVLLPGLLSAATPADALGDHMVLQRGKPVPIWGSGTPGETVTVRFAGQQKSATVGPGGRWLLRLDPMPASAAPRVLTIEAPSGNTNLEDVLVGDVWIAGGQSNMGRNVSASWRPEGFQLEHPNIRFLKVGSPGAAYPVDELAPPESAEATEKILPARMNRWNVCDGEATLRCTAVGFFFAHRLEQETGIPQGLLWNAVPGSSAREWIPREGWSMRPQLAATAREVDRWYPETEAGHEAFTEALKHIDTWTIQAEEAVRNGHPFPWPQPALPRPPLRNGQARGTTLLYNGRVQPLVPFAIRGFLWYQGEFDYRNSAYLHEMQALVGSWREKFTGPGEAAADLPFYYVQMQRSGSYMSPEVRDAQYLCHFTIPNTGMAVLLDLDIQLHPANKYDAGRRLALWSLAKDYGSDLAFSGPIYKSHRMQGDRVVVEFDHDGGGLFIGRKDQLKPVEAIPGGKLVNLEITANGKEWLPAKSEIDGGKLVVWAEGLSTPTHVRYCWDSLAKEPFLYNRAALPAGQFNTLTLTQTLGKEPSE